MNMNATSVLFDLPRMHTAIAQWLFCVIYIIPMRKKRFTRPVRALLCVGFFAVLAVLNLMGEYKEGLAWTMWFFLCLVVMLAMFMTLSIAKLHEAIYHWSQAFVAAEFSASLEWQTNYYVLHWLQLVDYSQAIMISYVVLFVIFLAVASLLFFMNNRHRAEHSRYHITTQDAASASLIAIAVFCISNIPFAFRESSFAASLNLGVLWIRTMADFGGIVMLEANESRRREINLNYELEATANMMHRQYEQYQMFQANDESLHRVYHDLKHQINYLRGEMDDDGKKKCLREMEMVIRRHEAAVDSGNTVLDTLLTSKNLICIKKGITMVCFADARMLDFMEAQDICSLFGNAIDNAIECVEKIADETKRLIHITVAPKNDLLFISFENCCEEELPIQDNSIRTTKQDYAMHGYGLKSIRHTVDKYSGYFKLNQADGWFSLTALIPIE